MDVILDLLECSLLFWPYFFISRFYIFKCSLTHNSIASQKDNIYNHVRQPAVKLGEFSFLYPKSSRFEILLPPH